MAPQKEPDGNLTGVGGASPPPSGPRNPPPPSGNPDPQAGPPEQANPLNRLPLYVPTEAAGYQRLFPRLRADGGKRRRRAPDGRSAMSSSGPCAVSGGYSAGSRVSEMLLMQYRWSVGVP